jgi:tartrate/fumarate subfamily iron-sulfur-dependent hydro-lyase alpha chain
MGTAVPERLQPGSPGFRAGLADAVAELYKRSLTDLPPDVRGAVATAAKRADGAARTRLNIMVSAVATSDETGMIVCQDTGICVFFIRIGTRFPLNGAALTHALEAGVQRATERYGLRSSVVHPITRQNRQTGTGPGIPVVHLDFEPDSDVLDILLMPKGSGSENMSFLKMLTPADGLAGVKRFVIECVLAAGPKPCPPTVVGVGLGGTADACMTLAKRATLRPLGEHHPEPDIAELERELLDAVNTLGIGPQGLGGDTTAFAVSVEYAWTHISMNPVAVNIQCWRGERARLRVHADGTVEQGY